MNNLKHVSDASLLQELERRQKERLKNPKPEPIPFEEIDWQKIYKMVVSDFEEQHGDDYHDDNDNDHYLWETAIQLVYGDKVIDYLNKLHR